MTEYGERDPDALRRRAGVVGDPRSDQHFLVDDRVLDRLPGYLPQQTDLVNVLEIGGGTGALTDRLLAIADHVTVIERDRTLASFLREEFAGAVEGGKLTVEEGDALEVTLPAFTASVSNLPYGIASEALFRLLPARRPMVAMVQREFADRMVAEVGTPEYGRLTVTAGHYAEVEIVEPVPAAAFDPQPAVESAVVRTRPRGEEVGNGQAPSPAGDRHVSEAEEFFLKFVTAVFTQRRKTMRNAIRNTVHISGLTDPESVLSATDESLLDRRPDAIAPDEFAHLASLAHERGDPS